MASLHRTRWIPETFNEKAEDKRKRAMVYHSDYENSWYLREIKNSKFTLHHIPESRCTQEMVDLHKFYWIM